MDIQGLLTSIAAATESLRTDINDTIVQIGDSPADYIFNQVNALSVLGAIAAICFGVVYILYGWRIFSIFVVLAFSIAGTFAGLLIGRLIANQTGAETSNYETIAGVAGLLVFGILSIPLMKICLRLLGMLAGAVIAAGVAYSLSVSQMYMIIAGVVGLIIGAVLSFMLFKLVVSLTTSLGGALAAVIGALGLVNIYEQSVSGTDFVHRALYEQQWMVPAAVLVLMFAGMIIQSRLGIVPAQKKENEE